VDPVMLLGLLAVGVLAGALGTLFGLGGGIIFVPVLTILFGLTPSEAAAVSLVGIIAASVGAASFYVEKEVANIRLGLLLEITTSLGAIAGAAAAVYLQDWILLVVFSAVLLYSGLRMALNPERVVEHCEAGGFSIRYRDLREDAYVTCSVQNVKGGLLGCGLAGMLSSMTGVGGGSIKVPLMNVYMHVPIKTAAATSSYMIGITAFSGAITYYLGGSIILDVAGAMAVGAFAGSIIGTRISKRMDASPMRRYMSVILFTISAIVLLRAGGIL